MDASPSLADWADGALTEQTALTGHTEGEHAAEVLVADSFLVADGRSLALGLHRARFLESAALQGFGDADELAAFWAAGVARLPRSGSWFPRFELVRVRDEQRLRFRLRPSPPLGTQLTVATAAADPRTVPDIKGPDIDRLRATQQAAQRLGAEEAVILVDGVVCDGTTTALVWWRNGALVAPPFTLARVDSVAARTVRGIAAALGVPVEEEQARPAELTGAVLWAVNALHGIREVTAWVEGPPLATDPERTAAWRARFAALARPLPNS